MAAIDLGRAWDMCGLRAAHQRSRPILWRLRSVMRVCLFSLERHLSHLLPNAARTFAPFALELVGHPDLWRHGTPGLSRATNPKDAVISGGAD